MGLCPDFWLSPVLSGYLRLSALSSWTRSRLIRSPRTSYNQRSPPLAKCILAYHNGQTESDSEDHSRGCVSSVPGFRPA